MNGPDIAASVDEQQGLILRVAKDELGREELLNSLELRSVEKGTWWDARSWTLPTVVPRDFRDAGKGMLALWIVAFLALVGGPAVALAAHRPGRAGGDHLADDVQAVLITAIGALATLWWWLSNLTGG